MTHSLKRLLLIAALAGAGALPAAAEEAAGPYLAARQATIQNDFREAVRYYVRAMSEDRENTDLMEGALTAYIGLGKIQEAITVASQIIEVKPGSQIANMLTLSRYAHEGDFDGLLAKLDAGQSVGELFDGLVRAWTLVGTGDGDAAIAAFEEVAAARGVEAFGIYHKALALAALGRFQEADAVITDAQALQLDRRGIMAHAQILSQLGRNDAALSKIEEGFGEDVDPILGDLRARLEAGETLDYTVTADAKDGLAEVLFSIANALANESGPAYTLIYARMSQYMRPDHIEATLLVAALLDRLEQYELAIEAYGAVPSDHPAFIAAEMGRAEVLRKSGREDTAIEVVRQLARMRPDNSMIQVSLGDALRESGRHAEAITAYDAAIELFDTDAESQWVVYFARAIARERTDNWTGAEADFLKSLELRPGQPQVLNYLGYSYVERGEKLDTALSMIEQAVAEMPDSGYITDSLGWVFYRLGRYQDAVEPMERAVELMPVDPVVNDHLGDVYWAVGRKLEARFQWSRALSFVENDENDEIDPDRIRAKLERGLDKVLEEEGADPLNLADE
ncbi:tetratricopeptide repeat protein [Profundibacterium mesophilum]|uniref:TPR domain protein n=1 Tax=Profundibacterium mesophilum KAUST100406-0324 TaxID=1037889 RepID=A0A921TD67_9RHOB|nr:tetratricopeptide repeat protein [Profundibacterium mesophilum]KAF0676468.1 TPR domain protein [Profundibacterium mesophilum KAUST100406-0324]